jgi:hypothetical protein
MNVRWKNLEQEYWIVNGDGPYTVERANLFAEPTQTFLIYPQALAGAGYGPTTPAPADYLYGWRVTFTNDCAIDIGSSLTYRSKFSDWVAQGWATNIDGPTGPQTIEAFTATLCKFLIRSLTDASFNPANFDLNVVFTQVPDGTGDYFMPVFCFFGNQGTHANLKLDEGNFTDSFGGMALDEGNFTDSYGGIAVDEGTF